MGPQPSTARLQRLESRAAGVGPQPSTARQEQPPASPLPSSLTWEGRHPRPSRQPCTNALGELGEGRCSTGCMQVGCRLAW